MERLSSSVWIDGCQNTTSNILKLESLHGCTSSKRKVRSIRHTFRNTRANLSILRGSIWARPDTSGISLDIMEKMNYKLHKHYMDFLIFRNFFRKFFCFYEFYIYCSSINYKELLNMSFVHLHTHTHYSFLSGLGNLLLFCEMHTSSICQDLPSPMREISMERSSSIRKQKNRH